MTFPITLSGNTLGKRHQELNDTVRREASKKVPFEQIQHGAEQTDIDRLFKIDLASQYKNIDYIIETLKCGDSLYISRALKCAWMYDDEYSLIINPNYLQQNVFISMSAKMQRQFLTAISIQLRNETRCEEFYKYCMITKRPKIAKKFLTFSSVEFKMNMIENETNTLKYILEEAEIVQNIVGDNITLAECYLAAVNGSSNALYLLRNLYTIDPERYLNWVEKYKYNHNCKTLGCRTSKDIMVKFKQRVVNHINTYLKLLKRAVFIRHTTVAEAKTYLTGFLPENDQEFWSTYYYNTYKFLLDMIPQDERYKFLKKIFTEKYPGREFEMTDGFFEQEYCNLMSVEEREAWAMRHIEIEKEISVRDKSYVFYAMVNIDVALEALKKYVLVTPNLFERAQVVNIIIESARTVSDLEKLLKYYQQRFANELTSIKRDFVNKVMSQHNVYEFNDSCWEAFQKILYNLEVFNPDANVPNDSYLQLISLIYHIVHKKEIPDVLKVIMDERMFWHKIQYQLLKLNDEKQKILCQFVLNLYVDQLKDYENKEFDDNDAVMIEDRLFTIRAFQRHMKISEETLPKIVSIITKMLADYRDRKVKLKSEDNTINEAQLIRMLKENATQAVDSWQRVKYSIENNKSFKFNTFLKKLRVYFANDIAQVYLKFFNACLYAKKESRMILIPVYGIFQLADMKYKVEFVEKYVPANPKIDHSVADRHHVYIQEGICRYAGYSRPPLPLGLIRKYINGDYLQYCVPMFNMNMANLRPEESLLFVESLIDSPASVQKHALRLAFKCFKIEELKTLTKRVWGKTKNISLRMVIFTSIFNEVVQRESEARDDMFQCLLELMSVVNEDDHREVLQLLSSDSCSSRGLWQLKDHYKATYIETAWKTINSFPNKAKNAKLRIAVINQIIQNIDKVDKAVIRTIIDNYLNAMFNKNGIVQQADYEKKIGDDFRDVSEIKERIVFSFINNCQSTDGIEIVRLVIRSCLSSWDKVHKRGNPDRDFFYIRDYCFRFIKTLIDGYHRLDWNEIADNINSLATVNPILECILTELQSELPAYEIYVEIWKLRLMMITFESINEAVQTKIRDSDTKINLFEELINTFAEHVSELVTELVSKNMLFMSFLDEISDELVINMNRLVDAMCFRYNYYDCRVLTALKLIETGNLEASMLAVKIMPDVGLSSNDKWKVLMEKCEAIDNVEFKSNLYKRFKVAGFHKL